MIVSLMPWIVPLEGSMFYWQILAIPGIKRLSFQKILKECILGSKLLMKLNDMEDLTEQERQKRFNISCCRSYLTPKGRCYTCPELDEFEQKDPDEEEY